jgi:hypothetical protein
LKNKFEVFPFTKENLCEVLRSKDQHAEDVLRKIQFPHISDYFTRPGKDESPTAKTMLIEKDYFSQSFFDDYKTKHIDSYSARELNKHCKRVHFFSVEFSFSEAKKIFFSKSLSKSQTKILNSYLGYIVIRPIQYAIGATILKWIPPTADRYNLPCLVKNNANLFGRKITPYSSLIFQEQDKLVGACATSALWSVLEKCSRNFKTMNYSPSRLTELAGENTNKIPRRLFPNNGLDINQLCAVIKRIGLDWEILSPTNESEKFGIHPDDEQTQKLPTSASSNKKSTPAFNKSDYKYLGFRSQLYAYCKGGFPSLFGIKFSDNTYHAIASMGYKELNQYDFIQYETELKQFNSAFSRPAIVNEMISEFIFHDDQIGPFTTIKIIKNQVFSEWNKIETGKIEPYSLLTPIHPTWIINHKHIESIVHYLDFQMKHHRRVDEPQKLYWDFHITKSNTFKTGIAASEPIIGKECILNSLPEYVWLIKVYSSIENIIAEKNALTVVADPTSLNSICPIIEILVYDNTILETLRAIQVKEEDRKMLNEMYPRIARNGQQIKTHRHTIERLRFGISFCAFLESKIPIIHSNEEP